MDHLTKKEGKLFNIPESNELIFERIIIELIESEIRGHTLGIIIVLQLSQRPGTLCYCPPNEGP